MKELLAIVILGAATASYNAHAAAATEEVASENVKMSEDLDELNLESEVEQMDLDATEDEVDIAKNENKLLKGNINKLNGDVERLRRQREQ